MTNILKYVLLTLCIGSLFSCATTKQPSQSTKTLTIGSQKVDCTGVGPQKCLQVKENESEEWTNFYGSIEGFDYKEGNVYQIEVAVTEVENPPADASSLNYKLVKILKETKDPYQALSGTWVIDNLNEKEADPLKTYISFEPSNNRINGYAGCNGLGGSMQYDAENNTIKAGPFMSTMMFCEEVAENERALSNILETFNKFSVEGEILTLYKDNEILVKAKKGVDHRDLFRNWEITSIEGVDDLGDNIPTIFFANDGKANGNGSCNKFNGSYTLNAYNNSIKIGPLMATRMACPGNEVENAFMMQVNTITKYEVKGKDLYLYNGDQLIMQGKRK